MSTRHSRDPDRATSASAPEAAPDAAPATGPAAVSGARKALALLGRPLVRVALLALLAAAAGYTVGAVRLAARERLWRVERAELASRVAALEASLGEARAQEVSYRVIVSVSRVVVALYDGNYGTAAEELRAVRDSVESVPRLAGSPLARRLADFAAELDELARRIEEMSRAARETVRGIEREVTRELFPAG